jgi:hypothetical protein
VIISFFANLCAPSEYVKVVVHPNTSVPAESLHAFEAKLKQQINGRIKRLKFSTLKDDTQGIGEVTVVYSRGKQDNRIIRTIKTPTELTEKTVEDILHFLYTIPNPSTGCH